MLRDNIYNDNILFADTSDYPPRGVKRTYKRRRPPPPQPKNENKMTCLVVAKPIDGSQFNQVDGKYILYTYFTIRIMYTFICV